VLEGACTGLVIAVQTCFGENVDDEIFEVCCEFLDGRISGRGIAWRRADGIVCEDEEEERKPCDEFCACDKQFQPDYDDSADDGCGSHDAGGSAGSAGRNDWQPYHYDSNEGDNGSGQDDDLGATELVWKD
jgi:hypothetical protein